MKAYRQHGGLKGAFLQLYRTDELKWGKLVGEDKYGNKYYHNPYYFIGRSRWVQFSDSEGMDYDGSQIPAEWHKWLHYSTDLLPSEDPSPKYKWIKDHKQNYTLDREKQYVPYSTTRPKIQAWKPSQVQK